MISDTKQNKAMRKLIVSSFVSLDGVSESPWEWVGSFFDQQNKDYSLAKLDDVDTFLLGRKTYERFSSTWANITGDAYFDKINGLPKLVASSTLDTAQWNATIIKEDPAKKIRELKAQPGKTILKYGIGPLDLLMYDNGLIDEFQIGLVPTTVGRGKHLFGDFDSDDLELKLVNAKVMDNGVIYLTYLPQRDMAISGRK